MKTSVKTKTAIKLVTILLLILIWNSKLLAQVGGQVPLNPKNVPQFVDPLPHFAYPGDRVDATTLGTHLTITSKETTQVSLSNGTVLAGGVVGAAPGVGLTRVWGYEIFNGSKTFPAHWPGATIVAKKGVPLDVTYANGLNGQTYSNVGLKVDQTVHWADPMGQMGLFSAYSGEPPTVTHLHGAEVSSLYDGGPDAWFTPGNAQVGPAWGDGVTNAYHYVNTQEPATLWYHDHALGVTRLNVYAGLAGFYFLKDAAEDALHLPGWSGDNKVQEVDRATGNPHGAPYLPEIELVFQDRMFDTDGQLYYPNLPTNPTVHPFWTPEFLGDINTVNGKTWPYLSVAPRKYRFRLLNGSNARAYELYLKNDGRGGGAIPIISQIGTDGGLLSAPVAFTSKGGSRLLILPGERVDIIIDFSTAPAGAVFTLRNSARAPFPGGAPPQGETLGRVMQFVVNGTLVGADNSQLPTNLRPTNPMVQLTNFAGTVYNPANVAVTRQLTLNEVLGPGGPLELLLNNTKYDGNGTTPGLGQSEIPTEGTTEVWQIINMTADAHPIHLHLIQFQLVSRQDFKLNQYNKVYTAMSTPGPGLGPQNPYNTTNADGAVGGNPAVSPYLNGGVLPANPNERGWKDTIVMYPGQVTTIVARWAPQDAPLNASANQLLFAFDPSVGPGYVWHCHILDHEDNEMMRPYKVAPSTARTVVAKANLAKDNLNASEISTANEQLPKNFNLEQNYPNPFNPSTNIKFTLPIAGNVRLRVYNLLGQLVKTLINDSYQAGNYNVSWDGTNDAGHKVTSGLYIYQLQSGNFVQSKKMLFIK